MARTAFSGFNDDELRKIASRIGFPSDKPLTGFAKFLSSNPKKAQQFMKVQNAAVKKMAVGGNVTSDPGRTIDRTYPLRAFGAEGFSTEPGSNDDALAKFQFNQQNMQADVFNNDTFGINPPPGNSVDSGQTGSGLQDPDMAGVYNITAGRLQDPNAFTGTNTTLDPTLTRQESGQLIDPTSGQAGDANTARSVTGTAAQATAAPTTAANTMTAATTADTIEQTLDQNQAAQGTVGGKSLLTAQTQDPTTAAVGNLEAAQLGQAQTVKAPDPRTVQQGEMISGSAVDMAQASSVADQTAASAAQATPSQQATVQGQLDELMTDFQGGQTPTWAAGAMRKAQDMLAARGLGASTIAGQAVVQAAMEAALPIASQDAKAFQQFEAMNLSNRQQTAMLAAQQRASFLQLDFNQEFQSRVANAAKVSDIANRNFSAEQQIALENARMAQTVDMANLSNQQALVMAEAAQMSNLEMANLNNRQAAAVQNAQAFLNMDMTNLSYQQQTAQINNQARIQGMFNDQAAQNAARQFNATAQNQVDQFYANLNTTVSQYNASQANAMEQFNVGQVNAVSQFNAQVRNQREQFNAQNRLVIDQSNAQWRRQLATQDTAAINFANQFNAEALLDVSSTAYNNLWQYNRDLLEWAWTSSENDRSRVAEMAIAEINNKTRTDLAQMAQDNSSSEAIGGFVFDLVKPSLSNFVGGLF